MDESALPELRRDLKAMRRELTLVRLEQKNLRRAVASVKELRGERAATQTDHEPKKEQDQVSLDDIEEHEYAWLDGLDRRLRAEVRDPEWSEAMETEIIRMFKAEDETQLISTECQATLCRAEVLHASGEAQDRFIERILSSPAARGGVFVKPTVGEDGSLSSVFYLSREGYAVEP